MEVSRNIMNRIKMSVIIGSVLAINANASLPEYDIITSPSPVSRYGNITRMSVKSENLEASVIVDVWVPADYDAAAYKG